jgi:hypothetical protein
LTNIAKADLIPIWTLVAGSYAASCDRMPAREVMFLSIKFRILVSSQEASYLIKPVDRASTSIPDELLRVQLPAPVTPVE